MPHPVRYLDRRTGRVVTENVMGEAWMRWFYQHPLGQALFAGCLRGKRASRLYGAWQDTRISARKIDRFIAEMGIDVAEVRDPLPSFASFNAFFVRHLKPEARPIAADPDSLISLGDGKLLVYPEVHDGLLAPVKGAHVSLRAMLADDSLYGRFEGGAALVLRLAPTDYHRFHFVADGVPSPARELPGAYDSVNPIALAQGRPIFAENHRAVSTLATGTLGTIATVEVGALFVGSIVQTYVPGQPVRRGQEKGYFQFGGSTVVQLFEPDRVRFDDDLVKASSEGLEVAVRLGERIATAIGP